MRVCVIGNSHVGALKRGWDRISEVFDSIEFEFFAAGGRGLDDLVVRDGSLVAGTERLSEALKFTSGGKCHVDSSLYDVFLIYGVLARPFFVDQSIFYSSQLIFQAVNDHVSRQLSFKILNQVREVSCAPIFVGHVPLPAKEPTESGSSATSDYEHGIKLVNRLIYMPLNARMWPQPVETIVDGRNTHFKYSRGSKGLDIGKKNGVRMHPDSDIRHMNDEFGQIWMESFIKALAP